MPNLGKLLSSPPFPTPTDATSGPRQTKRRGASLAGSSCPPKIPHRRCFERGIRCACVRIVSHDPQPFWLKARSIPLGVAPPIAHRFSSSSWWPDWLWGQGLQLPIGRRAATPRIVGTTSAPSAIRTLGALGGVLKVRPASSQIVASRSTPGGGKIATPARPASERTATSCTPELGRCAGREQLRLPGGPRTGLRRISRRPRRGRGPRSRRRRPGCS